MALFQREGVLVCAENGTRPKVSYVERHDGPQTGNDVSLKSFGSCGRAHSAGRSERLPPFASGQRSTKQACTVRKRAPWRDRDSSRLVRSNTVSGCGRKPVGGKEGSRVGWPARQGLPDICVHDLRRTFATRAASGGYPMSMLKDVLGHSSMETTARTASIRAGRSGRSG
jgi:hypothetical protein